MTSVNMPRDDAAIKITSKSTDRTVNPVEPYPRAQAITAHEDVTQSPPRAARRQDERRSKHRRQQAMPVILDTRDTHDRRNAVRQGEPGPEDEAGSEQQPGVDYYT